MPSRSAPGSRRNSVHFDDSSRPSFAADYGVDAPSRYRNRYMPSAGTSFFEEANFHLGSGRQGAGGGARAFGSSSGSTRGHGSRPSSSHYSHRRAESIPGPVIEDTALLDSLSVAQTQLASAGNLAMTLTRQLSAPLRPVFHITLFVWISSAAFLTLTGFLIASYLLTMWDDVGNRSRKVGMAATKARRNVQHSVMWGKRMLGANSNFTGEDYSSTEPDSTSQPYSTTGSRSTSNTANRTSEGDSKRKDAMSSFTPLSWAGSAASFFAFRLAPTSIAGLFENGSTPSSASSSRRGSSSQKKPTFGSHHGARPSSSGTNDEYDEDDAGAPSPDPRSSQMPPRPPLSMLIPSILFTILLALGAGLASFFASRKATQTAEPFKAKKADKGKGKAKGISKANGSLGRNGSSSNSSTFRERKNTNPNFASRMYSNSDSDPEVVGM